MFWSECSDFCEFVLSLVDLGVGFPHSCTLSSPFIIPIRYDALSVMCW